jgi:hypothetical protein
MATYVYSLNGRGDARPPDGPPEPAMRDVLVSVFTVADAFPGSRPASRNASESMNVFALRYVRSPTR